MIHYSETENLILFLSLSHSNNHSGLFLHSPGRAGVCTGEAFIFLRVPADPTIVYYFLSVPKGDIGEKTGWEPDSDEGNRLHLTAVGQMLAFTLRALKTPPRNQWRWIQATAQPKTGRLYLTICWMRFLITM